MIKIDVDGFDIGGDKTFIIADVGSNHMQDLSLAKESIDAVYESGANAVKFQSIQLDKLYLNPNQETTSFIKKLEFPEDWHQILNEYCKSKGITFFSSPTYLESIDLLEEIDISLYKIASAQIGTFPQLVEKVASLNKPTIFSTGISSIKNTNKAIEIFERYGNKKYMVLHCNSIYPTPAEKVNMHLLEHYINTYETPVGFSDHTIGTHIPVSAVVKGAKIIEKHFTLDRNLDTPDSNEFACDPDELKKLVKEIREVEKSHGSESRDKIQPEEQKFKDSIIYRVVCKKDIKSGEEINNDNVYYLRHPNGIDSRDFYELNGKIKAKKNLLKDTIITSEDFIIIE